MTQRLVIVGAGGHGRETLDVVEALNARHPTWEVVGVVAADAQVDRLERRGVAWLGDLDRIPDDASYVVGIGDSAVRREIDVALTDRGLSAATLVHPTATVGGDVRLGDGVVLAAGARVTTNVTLGRHTHLNVAAVVSHDCEVGDYVTLSPGALVNGDNTLGEGVFLGTGAIVTPRRRIGAWARVGAGAVVLGDVAARTTVVGVPARAVGEKGDG